MYSVKTSRCTGVILFSLILGYFGFMITSCGKRIPPPGGPVDVTSPRIVSLDPDSNSISVSSETTVRIGFSEEIVTRRGHEGFLLLPEHTELKLKYGWDYIEFRPKDGFRPACTYCVYLSGEIVDLRGNRLEDPPGYCFSTGDSIHSGIIKGLVEVSEGLSGEVYFQATHLPDSLIYGMGVDPGVVFSLTHLPRGVYHLLAYADIDRNRTYDPDEDTWDEEECELGDDILEVNFYLEPKD